MERLDGDVLDDTEFFEERQNLTRERIRVAQEIERLGETTQWFEPEHLLIQFNKEAAVRFRAGTPREKRFIVQTLGSNPRLIDRELKIDAAKPFRRWPKTFDLTDLRAFVHEVRTFQTEPTSQDKINDIKTLLGSC